MPQLSLFPHARCSDDRCRVSGWMRAEDQTSELVSGHLPGWDYHTDIRLVQSVVLDLDGIREDCSLAPGDSVAALAVWKSSATNLRGTSAAHSFSPLEGEGHADLEIEVEGREAGGSLLLETHLVAAPGADRNSNGPAPARDAALLWSGGEQEITLEGGGDRFPVEPVDFSKVAWLNSEAGWFLDWDSRDLTAPILGTMRLYLNASKPQILRAAASTDRSESDHRIYQTIHWDIGRQLIHAGLNEPEFEADPSQYPERSIGIALARLFVTYFPHDSAESLRERRSRRPEEFESEIQAAFQIFRDE